MNNLSVMLAMFAGLAARDTAEAAEPFSLQGTWNLVAADKILPGGTQVRDYGEQPKGRLIIDAQGRYSLQIFKSERLRFAADNKGDGSTGEFKSAVMGSSTHYGKVTIDAGQHLLVFSIEGSSFPNWEGTVQKREYESDGRTLSYRVPARADGSIPVSVWRKE
ncbi:MAG TPA: lipocalin-like domain-containing protein [Stenotrophomonas sp.]|nr:lipocalin-like domain-containing protein [Stenotrophomonas sp.]